MIPCLYAKVVYQKETQGKYGPGIQNHIMDRDGNVLVLSTWRAHMRDLKLGKSYLLYNVVVDHFTPPMSWYLDHPDVCIGSNRHRISTKMISASLLFSKLTSKGVSFIFLQVLHSYWMSLPYEDGYAIEVN